MGKRLYPSGLRKCVSLNSKKMFNYTINFLIAFNNRKSDARGRFIIEIHECFRRRNPRFQRVPKLGRVTSK